MKIKIKFVAERSLADYADLALRDIGSSFTVVGPRTYEFAMETKTTVPDPAALLSAVDHVLEVVNSIVSLSLDEPRNSITMVHSIEAEAV